MSHPIKIMDVGKIRNEGIRINFYPYKLYYLDNLECREPLFVISVSKRLFKRAVKRNLIRRRIKEAFRHISNNYPMLEKRNCLIVYTSNEILDYETIKERLETVLAKIS